MADNTKKGAWGDAETYALVYLIVQQLVGDGKTAIKFDKITLPGRTTRALSERWNKIKNDISAAGIATNQGPPTLPTPRAPRGSKSSNKTKAEGKGSAVKRTEEDAQTIDASPTPKRRKASVKNEKIKDETEDSNGEDSQPSPPKLSHSDDEE